MLFSHFVIGIERDALNRRPENIKILVGTNDLKSGGKLYPVSKLIAHEDYNQPHFANDVGLILIDGEIEYNEKVQPIKYSNKFVKGGTKLRVTGWGRLSVCTTFVLASGIAFKRNLNFYS